MATLLDALTAWRKSDDPWAETYADQIAEATAALRSAVNTLADAGDPDGLRVWSRLAGCSVADVPLIVGSELARLDADRFPPQRTDETAWCPTCRKRRTVEEVDPHASTYRGDHEYEWTATRLACGHTLEGPERIVGRAPGGEAAAEAMAGAATQARLARAAALQDDAPTW
jgi:hypothetical protein